MAAEEGSALQMVDNVDVVCTGWSTEKDESSSFTVYHFELHNTDGQEWSIKKRFNNFVELNDILSMAFPRINLPPLPEKRWFGNNNPDVLRDRSFLLQEYLQKILKHPALATTTAVNLFLELKRYKRREGRPIILVPLPDKDFDTTEVSVPWKLMVCSGFDVVFATQNGGKPMTDQMLIRPEGVIFGQLGAEPEAKAFYRELEQDTSFSAPITWESINVNEYDGLLLPGGHASGMRQYLEDKTLQAKVSEFWSLGRPVAAICHGVLLLARCQDPSSDHSVLYRKQTTTLPKYMENLGYYLTSWKHGDLYHTYQQPCEDEVKTFLENPDIQFQEGPTTLGNKGSLYDDSSAFIVKDGNYLSARWPGDAYLFGREFIKMVEEALRPRNKTSASSAEIETIELTASDDDEATTH